MTDTVADYTPDEYQYYLKKDDTRIQLDERDLEIVIDGLNSIFPQLDQIVDEYKFIEYMPNFQQELSRRRDNVNRLIAIFSVPEE
jgi:hypothetical protein